MVFTRNAIAGSKAVARALLCAMGLSMALPGERATIDKLEAVLGVSLALPEHEDEFDTAAGLAVALAGRLPQRGEILPHPAGFDVEIIDADPRRIKRLRVRLPGIGSAIEPVKGLVKSDDEQTG